jgi:hypothetical protein
LFPDTVPLSLPNLQLFGWQTFKRVGASLTINRLYKIVLVLSILIQLGFFFIAISVSLWIDQLVNSPIGDLASFQTLYKATSIAALVVGTLVSVDMTS